MPASIRVSMAAPVRKHTGRSVVSWNEGHLIGWGVAFLVLLAIFPFLPSMKGAFILDDYLMIVESDIVQSPDGLYRIWCTAEPPDYWPVTYTSFWMEWRLWDHYSIGYHFDNVLLHVASCLMIWAVLRKLAVPGAFFIALLYAVHPVNVESVAWISQRKNLLSQLFFLLSAYSYLTAELKTDLNASVLLPRGTKRFYGLSFVLFILAMLSKGSVATFPLLMLIVLAWRRRLNWRDFVRMIPFFLAAAILVKINVWFQTHGDTTIRDAGFLERLLGAGTVVWFYLSKAVWPLNLVFIYPEWTIDVKSAVWWLPLIAAVAVTAALATVYRHPWGRAALAAWLFFVVALIPVMGFVDVGYMQYSLVSDHYQHIAILGVLTLAGAGWAAWRRYSAGQGTQLYSYGVAVLLLVFLTPLAWQQSALYSDSITLYSDTLQKNPDCWLAHNNLGLEWVHIGKIEKGIEEYKAALLLQPRYPNALNNLGLAYAEREQWREAIPRYRDALNVKPRFFNAHYNLGIALQKTGQYGEAKKEYLAALALKPNHAYSLNNYGLLLFREGDVAGATRCFARALLAEPHYAEAMNNLGVCLLEVGRIDEAIDCYQKSLLNKPKYVDALHNLGLALEKQEKFAEAAKSFSHTLQLTPNHVEACLHLGSCLHKLGRTDEAIRYYQQALHLDPRSINPYMQMATVYTDIGRKDDACKIARKAVQVARSMDNPLLVKRIESWISEHSEPQ